MAYSIDWERDGVCISYTDVVGFYEFMKAVLTIHEHNDYSRFKYAIHDMTGVSRLDFSQVDMTQMLAQELGARYTNETIRASVVTSSPEMGELVRHFSSRTGLEVGLFQTLEQARAWSSLPGVRKVA